jgi:hypothetical protein
MKKRFYFPVLLVLICPVILLNSCENREDYSHIVYSNYLTYEIGRATVGLSNATEGTEEGNYIEGSKNAYQEVIDNAQLVADNSSSTQEEIDEAYADLLTAAEEFYNQMVPFRSVLRELLDYAEFLQANTEEGELEGNVKMGSKEVFQAAIDDAGYTISREDLTQEMLDQGSEELSGAIRAFNASIIGKAGIRITNQGFELPGHETTNFGEVDGWNVFGKAEDWAPLASVSLHDQAAEGQYVAVIGSYTQGIYQEIYELIQPNARYTVSARVSLMSNNPDWQGKKFPAILLTRLIVFEQGEGNYSFVSVISESYDTLGTEPGGFVELTHTVKIDAGADAIGKKLSIDFVQRHTWNAAEPIWAESFVALDDIRLYRTF